MERLRRLDRFFGDRVSDAVLWKSNKGNHPMQNPSLACPSACDVALAIARLGDFGDPVALAATVNGTAPGQRCEILSIHYRGRCVAWVTMPVGASRDAVAAAVLSRASWFLGSRCPEMETHPLSFT